MAWRLAFDKEYYIGEARAGPGGARGPGLGAQGRSSIVASRGAALVWEHLLNNYLVINLYGWQAFVYDRPCSVV